MHTRFRVQIIAIMAVVLLSGGSLPAQPHVNHERGLHAESYLSGTFDDVNLYNGNLTLTVPIGQTYSAGGNLRYQLKLVYNSTGWVYKTEEEVPPGEVRTWAEPNPKANAGLGWTLSLGAVYKNDDGFRNMSLTEWLYVSPDGAEHPLFKDPDGRYYSRDGTFLRFDASTWKLEFPDGSIHTFSPTKNHLTRMEDRFQNALNVSLLADRWVLTDTTGRTHTVVFEGGVVSRVVMSTFTGDATWELNHRTVTLARDFKDNWFANSDTVQVQWLTSVVLPANAGTYAFGYDESDLTIRGQNPGVIRSATLPTKGHYEWDWTHYQRPVVLVEQRPPDPDYVHPVASTEGVAAKRIYQRKNGTLLGTVTYDGMAATREATQTDQRGYVQVSVKSAEGNDTDYFFDTSFDTFSDAPGRFYGLPFSTWDGHIMDVDGRTMYLSRRHYKNNATGRTLQRSVYVTYAADPQTVNGQPPSNPRMTAERTIYHPDANYTETLREGWNGLGNFAVVKTRGSFPDDKVIKSISRDYRTSRPTLTQQWLLDLHTQEKVQEGKDPNDVAKYPIAYTYFCFDPNTGALLRKRTLVGSTIRDTDVFVAYEYTNGNLTSEAYYGGDDQPFNAPLLDRTQLCSDFSANADSKLIHGYEYGSRKWSKYVLADGTDYFTLNQVIERRSGLASSSKDVSNVNTTYGYDALGRMTSIGLSTGAVTTIEYQPALDGANQHALVRHTTMHNGVEYGKKELRADAFGRTISQSETLPGGITSTQVTDYTPSGWVKAQSEAGDTTKKTKYEGFDAFGRPTTITAPDGSVTTVKYTGVMAVERKRQIGTQLDAVTGNVNETGAVVVEHYDSQGRLSMVREKSGPLNSPVETKYTYDMRDNLLTASINHGGGGTDRRNVALAANGAQALVSSLYDGNRFPAEAMINGDVKGIGWGFGTGGWSDGTAVTWPDYVGIQFDGFKTIDEIGIYTLQDDYTNPVEPTEATTFSLNGIQDFKVGYYDEATNSYIYLPAVTNNNKVWRRFILPAPVRTDKLSIVITRSVKNYSRIVEVTAYEAPVAGGNQTQVRKFNVDHRGFLQSEVHPEIVGGVTYRNDALGRVVEKTEGNHKLVYARDAAGRLTSVRGANLTAYDTSLRDLKQFQYHTNSAATGSFRKMAKATRNNWITNPYLRCFDEPGTAWNDCPVNNVKMSEQYQYNLHGQMTTRTTRFAEDANGNGAYTFQQTFGWDPVHHLTSQTYPVCLNATCIDSGAQTPREITYRYDRDRITGVGVPGAPAAYAALTYHNNGMLHTIARGNNVTDTYGKDPNSMRRIQRATFTGPSASWTWNTGAYEYDGAGNVIHIGLDRFLYDPANRIREGTAGPDSGGRRKQRYNHDPLGNVDQVLTTEYGVQRTLNVNVDRNTNRLLDSYYDNAGNFLGLSAGPIYQYDPLNMLQRTPGRTYLYGPTDERLWIVDKMFDDTKKVAAPWPAIVETITLRGLGNEVLREYSLTQRTASEGDAAGNWQWMKDYIYRGKSLLAAELTGNGKEHFHLDHLGSTRIVTNQFGGRTAEYWLYPYGGDAPSNALERIRFTGHERDFNRAPGHKFDYMHARYYGMDVGRFTSVDPGRDFDPRQPQSWNLYTYVRANPMNAVDPDGRQQQQTFQQAPTDGMDGQQRRLAEWTAWVEKEQARCQTPGAQGCFDYDHPTWKETFKQLREAFPSNADLQFVVIEAIAGFATAGPHGAVGAAIGGFTLAQVQRLYEVFSNDLERGFLNEMRNRVRSYNEYGVHNPYNDPLKLRTKP